MNEVIKHLLIAAAVAVPLSLVTTVLFDLSATASFFIAIGFGYLGFWVAAWVLE
jgi:hypothetical protein